MREKVRERKGRVQERKMWALEGKVGVILGFQKVKKYEL